MKDVVRVKKEPVHVDLDQGRIQDVSSTLCNIARSSSTFLFAQGYLWISDMWTNVYECVQSRANPNENLDLVNSNVVS